MDTTASFLHPRVLTAGEVRALKNRARVSGRKRKFLHAIVGSMSEEEVAELEQRVHRMAERVDDRDQNVP